MKVPEQSSFVESYNIISYYQYCLIKWTWYLYSGPSVIVYASGCGTSIVAPVL